MSTDVTDYHDEVWAPGSARVALIFQPTFAVLIALVCLFAALADVSVLTDAAALSAIVLVAAGLVAALVGEHHAGPRSWRAALPIANFMAVILLGLATRDGMQAIGILAVLPAFWLALFPSAILTVVVIVLTLGLVDPSAIGDPASRAVAVLTPLVVLLVALTVRLLRTRITRLADREQAASELIDRIIDTVDIGIVAVDRHGTEVLANATVRNHPLLARDGGSVIDLEKHGLLYEQDRHTPVPEGAGPVARAMGGEAFSNVVYWVGPPEARQHAILVSADTLHDRNGEFSGAVFAFDEVTEYIETLRATDDFVGTVSHEFRTPLTSIVGYLELIGEVSPRPSAEVTLYLDVIGRNVDRLRRLVENLLEAGAEPTESRFAPEPLDEIVRAACERAEQSAAARGIRLEIDAADAPTVRTDAAKLGLALDALLENAVKFSDDGESVRVTAAESATGGTVTIEDTGIGIPRREQHMLGTRFFRGINARDGAFQGTGLGFARADELVRGVRGSLVVRSAENAGTTVTLTLPRD
ncbi:Signal transduction histidine kinase [Paramicrobacterium humi]|uniref:Sensor-like histidine kinase SenX3 n=1 Tax=Paramicrobacterium humi TaxID=640635 RepID=A0A1H4N1Q6_9MICO|nr:HAMP domain-containing sensor histidine kinase [Microbacterium humi]SEB89199.1 Signal transduction histidine kinase [Microbacterium humi]